MQKSLMTYSLIGFSFLLLATACSAMPVGSVGVSLTGKSWILNILNGESVPSETAIFLTFVDDNTAAGSAGCNNYNTTYTVTGNKISFNEAMAVTGKLCAEPIMALESRYLQALSAAATYKVSGHTLTLFDASGKPLAEYSEQSNKLGGSAWKGISYNNGTGGGITVMAGTELTANFSEAGQLSGSAGCNDYSATYETDGNNISIGPIAVTQKMCVDAEMMEQESKYLAALETAASYKLIANSMSLHREDGATAVNFQRLDSQGDRAAVSGMVTNVDNAAIPASATATIQIQDTSLADAPATVIGEQIIENPGQFPIAYQVTYDPSVIIDNHTYTMSARITADGRLLFINDMAIPVISRGNPTADVEIPVIRTGG